MSRTDRPIEHPAAYIVRRLPGGDTVDLVLYPLELARHIGHHVEAGTIPNCPYCGDLLRRDDPIPDAKRRLIVLRCDPCRRAALLQVRPVGGVGGSS